MSTRNSSVGQYIATKWHNIIRKYNYRQRRRAVDKKEYERTYQMSQPRYRDSGIAFELVKALAIRPHTEVMYAPISGEYYIVNEEDDQYVIITQDIVSIINGTYHHPITMPEEATEYLFRYLKRIVERKRMKIKKRIESKAEKSLYNILERSKKK